MGLIARTLEEQGIATVCVMTRTDLAELVKAPRTLINKFPYGAPLGQPGNQELRKAIVRAALDLLVTAREPGTTQETDHKWKS